MIYNLNIQGFLISFLLAVLIVPVISKFCLKNGIVDKPNKRKIHKQPTPRLGGVAIWLCTIMAFFIITVINFNYPFGSGLSGIFIGGTIMFLLGLVDDVYDLSPGFKLFIQISAAIIAFLLGVQIDIISNPFGDPISLGMFSFPITLIWLVGISNAVNFIDGVDGLAGGVTTIMAITLGVVAIASNQPASSLVAVLLAGAILGFLAFNFYPAKIFMGDSGALFSGFVLAGLSVTGLIKTVAMSVLLPLLIFVVPIADMSFSIFRRLLKGDNPMIADDNHIHHKLIKSGLSQNRTAAVLYSLCVAGGAIAAFMVKAHIIYLSLIFVILIVMALLSHIAKVRRYKELKDARQK